MPACLRKVSRCRNCATEIPVLTTEIVQNVVIRTSYLKDNSKARRLFCRRCYCTNSMTSTLTKPNRATTIPAASIVGHCLLSRIYTGIAMGSDESRTVCVPCSVQSVYGCAQPNALTTPPSTTRLGSGRHMRLSSTRTTKLSKVGEDVRVLVFAQFENNEQNQRCESTCFFLKSRIRCIDAYTTNGQGERVAAGYIVQTLPWQDCQKNAGERPGVQTLVTHHIIVFCAHPIHSVISPIPVRNSN